MSSDLEVRIKLPLNIHKKWSDAASVRGLSLKGFIAATISGELIRTGELVVTAVTATNTPLPAATKPAPEPRPTLDYAAIRDAWSDDDEDTYVAKPKLESKPKPAAEPIDTTWMHEDIDTYTPDPSVETSKERLERLKREAIEAGEYDEGE